MQDEESGVISDGSPLLSRYASSTSCSWHVHVPGANGFRVDFERFEMSEVRQTPTAPHTIAHSPRHDTLSIFDRDALWGRYHGGEDLPDDLVVAGDYLRVAFETSADEPPMLSSPGFTVKYTTVPFCDPLTAYDVEDFDSLNENEYQLVVGDGSPPSRGYAPQTVCEWRFDLTGYEASIDLTYMCLGCGFTPHDCAVPGEQHSFREYDTGAAGYC
eukprot:scaffold347_cov380-Prasinococcus_capsulatus_cf.AAC.10